MKLICAAVLVLFATSFANADLVKHLGKLKSANPTSGELTTVFSASREVRADDVEIISANLVLHFGRLCGVDPMTSKLSAIYDVTGEVRASDVSK
ncbi:MAG: hypothetical protein EOP04_14090 [Proteobacteria bacterium]|nr:MAG: hypothetical protein EOP04_14090 [Pseudomonadota bacterium]